MGWLCVSSKEIYVNLPTNWLLESPLVRILWVAGWAGNGETLISSTPAEKSITVVDERLSVLRVVITRKIGQGFVSLVGSVIKIKA